MNIKKSILTLAIMLVSGGLLFATTAADRSEIEIEYRNFGWTGVNAGWEEDECLISPEFTLDYPIGETNRDQYPAGSVQFLYAPEYQTNWGEMLNNEFSPFSNDNVCPQAASDGTDGDISELWVTWDEDWFYCAVKGEMRNQFNTGNDANQGVNLMVLFDRVDGFGTADLTEGDGLWEKGVYTRNFLTDMYIGVYGGWTSSSEFAQVGGFQLVIYESLPFSEEQYIVDQPADGTFSVHSSLPGVVSDYVDDFYNGGYEFDSEERVLLFKIRMDLFTNEMSTVSDITLKIIALSCDGLSSGAARTYDFCPNNLAGMNSDRKSVADNYFLIPFTDSAGNVLMDVSPKYDSQVVYLPGSRSFTQPVFTLTNYTEGTSDDYQRSVFIPQEGEDLQVGVTMASSANLFNPSITIYSLRGEVIRDLSVGTEWTDGSTERWFSWNGRDNEGYWVPTGNYVVVYSGLTEDGLTWAEKSFVSVIH